MRRTTLALGLAGALLTGALTTAPAVADGPHDGPVSVDTTVPAGGYSTLTSQTIPRDADGIKVIVKPKAIDATQEDAYDHFLSSMGTMSKSGRLLVCVMMYQMLASPRDYYSQELDFNAAALTVAGTLLLACLHMAGLLESRAPVQDRMSRVMAPPAAAAGTGCGQKRPKIPATLEKTDDGATLTASGTTSRAKPTKVKVGCALKGNRLTYKIRPVRKGATLRSAIGKSLSFGLKSPGDAESSVPVTVTFDPF